MGFSCQVIIFQKQDVKSENEARVQLRRCSNVIYLKWPILEAKLYDRKMKDALETFKTDGNKSTKNQPVGTPKTNHSALHVIYNR